MIIIGSVIKEITVLISMQSEVNSLSSLYVMASNNDIIPDGIAASTTDILNCKSTKPISEAIRNAINGKNATS